MSLYDEGNPLLRSRPFWEEEEEEPTAVAVAPVTPPAVPELPEVEGEGYASPEEAAGIQPAPSLPEIEGQGYDSPEEAAGLPKLPEVEGEGYASPEEAAGGVKPSLGDLARLGYRTLIKPLTKPVEVAREGVHALAEAVEPEEGSRRAEFGARIKRNTATGMEEVKAAYNQNVSRLLSAEQNPYIGKSTEQAKADVPLLEGQIAEAEKSLKATGGNPDLVGQEWYYGTSTEPGGALTPENREKSQRIGDLRRQLGYAKESLTGLPTESFAGALSRSSVDIAEANRDRKAEIIKEYAPLINESRNKEVWMQVADSIGSSVPGMGASMLNPVFGLSVMYAQTYETSREEFLKNGGDPEKADEYAHTQAILQTPFEIFGELAVANLAKNTLRRLVKEGTPDSWVKFIKERAIDLGKAAAGEVGITTPAQTVLEQKAGEAYGVKPVKTWGELMGDVGEAQKVAALQTFLLAGGPTVVETGGRVAAQALQPPVAPAGAPAVPPSTVAPPPIPPTPPEAFAPPGTAVEAPGTPPGAVPGAVTVGPPFKTPEAIEPGVNTPAGAAVTQEVGKQNRVVTEVADAQAQNLQASNAPKTAEAIQQVASRSNAGATVTAAEFLEQAKVQAAEAQAEAQAAPPAAEGAPVAEAPVAVPVVAAPRPYGVPPPLPAPPEAFAPPPAVAAPAPAAPAAPRAEPQAAVVVGGQVFTGPTHEDAVRAAHTAVGADAMASAEGGWVDPDTGRFVSHGIYQAHQALNAAIEQAGGNMEAPGVQQAGAQLAEAQERDTELNNQIVLPGGEQVVQPGIKGQEALVATRPSQELAVPLAGVTATIEGVDAQGRRTTSQRPAAQALNDARNDRTALTLLLDCLI